MTAACLCATARRQELREQTQAGEKLDKLIWANLEEIGYGN